MRPCLLFFPLTVSSRAPLKKHKAVCQKCWIKFGCRAERHHLATSWAGQSNACKHTFWVDYCVNVNVLVSDKPLNSSLKVAFLNHFISHWSDTHTGTHTRTHTHTSAVLLLLAWMLSYFRMWSSWHHHLVQQRHIKRDISGLFYSLVNRLNPQKPSWHKNPVSDFHYITALGNDAVTPVCVKLSKLIVTWISKFILKPLPVLQLTIWRQIESLLRSVTTFYLKLNEGQTLKQNIHLKSNQQDDLGFPSAACVTSYEKKDVLSWNVLWTKYKRRKRSNSKCGIIKMSGKKNLFLL